MKQTQGFHEADETLAPVLKMTSEHAEAEVRVKKKKQSLFTSELILCNVSFTAIDVPTTCLHNSM